MARTFFVPARNSRHRIAALALYRSLVRTARQISLADDAKNNKPGHPVAQLVRKRFEGHKTYTSLRLVYSSMTAGYKFLTMLRKAKIPESPEHHEVVSLLRTRNQKAAKQRANTPPPPPSRGPRNKETHPHLLTKVSGPAERPKYISESRPSESVKGPRRVPNVAAEAHGFPFIRYTKPHPKDMDQMVRRNRNLYVKRIEGILWAEDQLAQQALLEDQWDERVYREMVAAGLAEPGKSHVPQEETFVWNALKSKLWYEWRLENMWEHWTARGEALQKLADEERVLAAKEKGESDYMGPLVDTMGPREEPQIDEPRRQTTRPILQRDKVSTPRRFVPMPALAEARSAERKLVKKGVDIGLRPDPFSSPVWAQCVENSEERLKIWVKNTRHNNGKGQKVDDDDPLVSAMLLGRQEL